jgi:hypothetical protein
MLVVSKPRLLPTGGLSDNTYCPLIIIFPFTPCPTAVSGAVSFIYKTGVYMFTGKTFTFLIP